MPDPSKWSFELLPDSDGRFRLEILDERGNRVPVARQISAGQARQLVAEIEAEARRRRFAVAEILQDPDFMARTIIAVKRRNGS